MTVERRRIEHLSLRTPQAADVPKATRTIREALRLATMPGEGRPGRLFIRRIELPVIRLGAGAHPIARWLSMRLRELRWQAVPISDRRAALADVVIARDPIEPLLLALRQAAAGQRLTEWFWPRVHPRLDAERSPLRIVAEVWVQLARQEHAVAAVPAVVGALLDAADGAAAFAAIDPVVGDELARALGEPSIPASRREAVLETAVPRRWRSSIERAVADWGGDARATWLVTAAARAAHPRLSASGIAALAARTTPPESPHDEPTAAFETPAELASAPTKKRAATPPPPSAVDPSIPPARAAFVPPHREAAAKPSTPEEYYEPSIEPAPAADGPALARPGAPGEAPAAPEPQPAAFARVSHRWTLLERPQPTRFGGLYFLLRPLSRLGLSAFIESDPRLDDADLGLRVLGRIADALEIPPDDPIRVPLQPSPLPARGQAPSPPTWDELWPDPATRPRPRGVDPWDDLLEAWHAAVSTWLHHLAELDLRTVVHRDAAVMCSRTHLDVIFDMESSDIRIRRAALDVDPGWVRWFGRVVQFHYVLGGMLDA